MHGIWGSHLNLHAQSGALPPCGITCLIGLRIWGYSLQVSGAQTQLVPHLQQYLKKGALTLPAWFVQMGNLPEG